MGEPLDWENLRIFAALKRHKSFAAAARPLGVNATTLARRLTALEKQLGVLLFQRTAEGLVPTEAAATLGESVLRMEREIELLQLNVAGRASRLEGAVRLAVTEGFAESFLLPRWQPLHERHPGIELHLLLGDAYADLARGEADLAVRFQQAGKGAPSQPGSPIEILARRIGRIEVGIFASRAYLARRGDPRGLDDLEGHDLVLPRLGAQYLPGAPWFSRVSGRAVIRTDGIGSMTASIVAGLGVGAIATDVAATHPGLKRIGDEVVDRRDAWLLVPADLAKVGRVRAVWDYILELASARRGSKKT